MIWGRVLRMHIQKTSAIAEFPANMALVEAIRLKKKACLTIDDYFYLICKLNIKQIACL